MGPIILATDFSPAAARAYEPAGELARRYEQPIVLVHAVTAARVPPPRGTPLPPVAPDAAHLTEEARVGLAEAAARLGSTVPVQVEVLTGETPAAAIVDYAKRVGAGFIALSTHGRTGVRRLVLGSVAEAVLRHARTPVVCFPAS
jgi:nucleotide-binding universal stress UspA family protein